MALVVAVLVGAADARTEDDDIREAISRGDIRDAVSRLGDRTLGRYAYHPTSGYQLMSSLRRYFEARKGKQLAALAPLLERVSRMAELADNPEYGESQRIFGADCRVVVARYRRRAKHKGLIELWHGAAKKLVEGTPSLRLRAAAIRLLGALAAQPKTPADALMKEAQALALRPGEEATVQFLPHSAYQLAHGRFLLARGRSGDAGTIMRRWMRELQKHLSGPADRDIDLATLYNAAVALTKSDKRLRIKADYAVETHREQHVEFDVPVSRLWWFGTTKLPQIELSHRTLDGNVIHEFTFPRRGLGKTNWSGWVTHKMTRIKSHTTPKDVKLNKKVRKASVVEAVGEEHVEPLVSRRAWQWMSEEHRIPLYYSLLVRELGKAAQEDPGLEMLLASFRDQ